MLRQVNSINEFWKAFICSQPKISMIILKYTSDTIIGQSIFYTITIKLFAWFFDDIKAIIRTYPDITSAVFWNSI